MQTGWRLGSLLGIPFFIDYSWLPIAVLMALSYAASLSSTYPQLSPAVWGLGGILMALGLFGSVLAHEMAHSLVAQSQGIRVNSITLFIFGGMASIEREARSPMGAFWIAVAGPALSLGLFIVLKLILGTASLQGGTPSPLTDGIAYLASVNLVIGVFNLIPGLPLDGGQILKAAVWGMTGDQSKGILWAARSGQWFGFGLVALGLWLFFLGQFSGLWMGLMGLFILNNARNYIQFSQLQQALQGLKARDVMTRQFRVVDSAMSLREFVDRYLVLAEATAPSSDVFFAEHDGRYRGKVVPERLRTLERSLWDGETVESILQPMNELQGVPEESPITQVIRMMRDAQLKQVAVLTMTGSIAGLVDKGDIVGGLAKQLGVMLPPEILQRIREQNEFPPGFQLESISDKLSESQTN